VICQPCTVGAHDECEDRERHRRFLQWVRETFINGVTEPDAPHLIAVNRPYDACACQHKVDDLVAAVPVDIPGGTPQHM
jgi:hypothetical protein